MTIRLWNSQTSRVEEFTPQDPDRVTMYVCGPTVYNTPHIGNLRPAVAFDQLFRLLQHDYGEDHVVYTSNYTDIDDKIIARSEAENVPIEQITEQAIVDYSWARFMLNVQNPTVRPRATEYVGKMIQMIQQLMDTGFAYVGSKGDVLFRVSANKNPGMEDSRSDDVSRLETDYKEDARDFVLWKPKKPGEPFWSSPWGEGRPGWHIECSAMIADTLGTTIDIHGGGSDLKFPHHNAEMAQSSCTHGAPLANYWLHSGMIQLESVKMAKSLGNIITVEQLCRKVPNEVVRMGLMSTHYRSNMNLNPLDPFVQQRGLLDRYYRLLYPYRNSHLRDQQVAKEVLDALRDDLNTPLALTALHDQYVIAKSYIATKNGLLNGQVLVETFLSSARFMGLLYHDPADWFHRGVDETLVERLISERNSAKADKDWSRADAIRQQISELDVTVEDTGAETFWFTNKGAVLRS